ncbi:hypothetical protein HAX54_038607 [Datura stramonium]|uniref:Uncharacterized protein n=1 Tax=Datura stramonium TaxID=4076 RepID=A0ABS8VLR1_DATST|nr:hypothetical protein [Datura stramonium]
MSLIGRDPCSRLHALVNAVIDPVSEMESQSLEEVERRKTGPSLIMERARKSTPEIITLDNAEQAHSQTRSPEVPVRLNSSSTTGMRQIPDEVSFTLRLVGVVNYLNFMISSKDYRRMDRVTIECLMMIVLMPPPRKQTELKERICLASAGSRHHVKNSSSFVIPTSPQKEIFYLKNKIHTLTKRVRLRKKHRDLEKARDVWIVRIQILKDASASCLEFDKEISSLGLG